MGRKAKEEDQPGLPGIAPEKNAKIHRAARNYDKAKDLAAEAREVKNDKQKRLIEVCIEQGYEKGYRFGDVKVEINNEPTVKCKVGEAAPEIEDEEEESDPETDATE